MPNNKAFSLIIGACLVGAVLGAIPGQLPFRQSEILIAKILIMAMIAFLFIRNWWFKLFVIWSAIRTLITLNPYATTVLNAVFLYAIGYQTLSVNMTDGKANTLLNILGVIVILQLIMMILQYNGLWAVILPQAHADGKWIKFFDTTRWPVYLAIDPARWHKDNINGFTSVSSMSGALLALGLPVFMRRAWLVLIPVILWGIAVTSSITAVIMAVFVLAGFGILKKEYRKWTLILSVTVVLLTISFRLDQMLHLFNMHGRVELWSAILKHYYVKHPVMGWGIGSIPFICGEAYMRKLYTWYELFRDPHNDYLTILIESGAVGLFLVTGGFISTLWGLYKGLKKGEVYLIVLLGILAGMICAGANFIFRVTQGIMVMVYLSIGSYLTRRDSDEKGHSGIPGDFINIIRRIRGHYAYSKRGCLRRYGDISHCIGRNDIH